MVWWIDNCEKKKFKTGGLLTFQSLQDRIYPSVNVMMNCHGRNYDSYDIHILANVGVNIFNVDLTVCGKDYLDSIKTALLNSEKITEMYPKPCYRPVGLSIVISVNEPFDIDDEVDIIILKDVTKTEQLLEFRKRNTKFTEIPILFWTSSFQIEDRNELIKFSDGVVAEFNCDIEEHYYNTLKACKEACKSFFLTQTLIEDFHEITDLQMLTITSKLVRDHVDGIVVTEEDVTQSLPIDVLRSFSKANDIAEQEAKMFNSYLNFTSQTKSPVLPPHAVALSASLAALQSGADAILVLTVNGSSARLIASSLPPCYVFAITTHASTARRLHLYKKIIPLFYNYGRAANWHEEVQRRISFGSRIALNMGVCNLQSKLVVLTRAEEDDCYCNSFQIVEVRFTYVNK